MHTIIIVFQLIITSPFMGFFHELRVFLLILLIFDYTRIDPKCN